ncbi:DNA-3-methyladenine glycosylase I [Clostridium hydrogeniformans]|uniref:DNA-3-methyladenine glycosylase I n=1 Tax=Clostridium hydrogeniformans TaxID=349933 RepID=UPI0006923C41|nr:DNA-3-methyladenine glycosylase I [Clostridium hydrogeniformans]
MVEGNGTNLAQNDKLLRCQWANNSSLERKYHDEEWGRPVHDDIKLFEMLILEGKQSGLSWSTILSKRETLREAFHGFDPSIIINYDENKIEELLQNTGVIRNRLKIKAVIDNAKAYYKVKEQYGTLDEFFWRYVNYTPIINHWKDISEVPSKTELSNIISKDLKKLGFKFVGSTSVYSFMQSSGMINDHITTCFLYDKGEEEL